MKENDLTLTDMLEIKIQLLFSHYTIQKLFLITKLKRAKYLHSLPFAFPIRIPSPRAEPPKNKISKDISRPTTTARD